MTTTTPNPNIPILHLPPSLRIISLNCWGLKFISTHRSARLLEIGRQLSLASPTPTLVGLQECWTQADYLAVRSLTKSILPYGKFYFSGIFGSGLAILSKYPIEESSMYRYPLNGRPSAFYRGDWYVGKGVACARIRMRPGKGGVVEVFCTHLHAPYAEAGGGDSYACHRVAQAWEVARLMRWAGERGHGVVGLGDFNSEPGGLGYRVVVGGAGVRDVWRVARPESAVERKGGKVGGGEVPSSGECLRVHGATCDSRFNTWRWSRGMRRELERGRDHEVDPEVPDPRARRLDYVFFASPAGQRWEVENVEVGMTMRHPTLRCSLSDHFSVETTLVRQHAGEAGSEPAMSTYMYLPIETYDEILAMIATYNIRERKQRRLRLTHFVVELFVALGCFVAVWWSPHNFVAFLLMLLSTLGLSAGVLDGLMGGLFVGSEIRALKEFEYEVRNAREQALRSSGSNP
ncbi:phospholipase C type enzyme [Friedmanniomyces endolithicus]|nr:phospholipase C type enzyme [Friedmanniomyces endolithicus]KAK0884998.1 phospholipase C type enzyme [Friedmanniomyces endolithicus]